MKHKVRDFTGVFLPKNAEDAVLTSILLFLTEQGTAVITHLCKIKHSGVSKSRILTHRKRVLKLIY